MQKQFFNSVIYLFSYVIMRKEAVSLKIDIKLSEVSILAFYLQNLKKKLRTLDFSLKKFFTI